MNRRNIYYWLLLPVLALMMGACSESNNNEEPAKPDTPANPVAEEDWQSVPASGGTIKKGDIALTFPAGTFDTDTKVAITEVEKGGTIGRCEASPFYQLTLPLKTNKPFTVQMKSDYTDGGAEFVVLTAGHSISYDRDVTNETVLETIYSNGEYAATMPIIEGNDSRDNGSIIIGLGRLPDDLAAATRTFTRGVVESVIGKDGNVKWNLSINYGYIDKYSSNYNKLCEKLIDVNKHIKEAIKTIHDLGLKVPDGVTLNYRIKNLKGSFGEYSPSSICRSRDCIYLHDNMILGGNTGLINQTIIHETLHNFQTYYLPNYYLPYRMNAMKNDQRSLYEIGAIWIEKYANGGNLNGNWQIWEGGLGKTFKNHFRIGLSLSNSEVKTLYDSYDQQGYVMAPLLYHMINKNNWTTLGDTVVANLHSKFMAKIDDGYTLTDVLNEWYHDNYNDYFFNGTDNINDYYLKLWKGELMKDFNISMFEQYMEVQYDIKTDYMNEKNSKFNLDGKVYPYGCEGLIFRMDYTCFKDSLLNNDEMVIKQEAEGLKTYLLYSNGDKIIQYPKVAARGDSICIPGTELETLRTKGRFNNYFFLLTVREKGSLTDRGSIPSKTSVELREYKVEVKPTEMSFEAEGGTQEAKVTAPGYSYFGVRVDEAYSNWLSATPTKGGKVTVTAKANSTSEPRTGYVRSYVAKSAEASESEWVWLTPIKVTQKAGEANNQYIYARFSVYLDCTIMALSKSGDYVKSGDALQWGSAVSSDRNGYEMTQDASGHHFSQTESYTIDDTHYENTLTFSLSGLEGLSSGGGSIGNVKSEYREKSSTKDVYMAIEISGFKYDSYFDYENGLVTVGWEIRGKDIQPSQLKFTEYINGKLNREFYKLNPSDNNLVYMSVTFRK